MLDDKYKMNKFLGKITTDFVKIYDKILSSSYEIRKRGYDYPVFIVSKNIATQLGPILVPINENKNIYSYHVSYLNALVSMGFITNEKIDNFKKNYKNPDEYCCILVIDAEFKGFLYVPFPNED